MSVLFEFNGIFLISATADFFRRYASYVIRHVNWFLLIAIPPSPIDLDGQPFRCVGSESLYLKWVKSVKVLQIQKQRVEQDRNIYDKTRIKHVFYTSVMVRNICKYCENNVHGVDISAVLLATVFTKFTGCHCI